MQEDLKKEESGYLDKNRRRRVWKKVVSALACMVVFCTISALILPAITMENKIYCKLEEHIHTEECYKERLVQQNVEDSFGENQVQKPTESYVTEDLAQQQTENYAAEEMVQQAEGYVAEDLVQQPTENYAAENLVQQPTESYAAEDLTQQPTESYAAEDLTQQPTEDYAAEDLTQQQAEDYAAEDSLQQQTEERYESVLICGKEEHTHGLACHSDPEADVESQEDWTDSVSGVELTGDWRSDVIAVAKSQIGYTESSKNYMVDEDGETKKGYTRYGQWYGEPYRDWDAMFVSFCLHYANVSAEIFPQEASCPSWVETLQKEEYNFYRMKEDYVPIAGDLIFFDQDDDQIADHVGIAAEIFEATETEPAKLRTIVGDSEECVQYKDYEQDAPQILGYAVLPENPDKGNEEQQEEGITDGETEQKTLTYRGEDYTVQVRFTEEAQIPENAVLSVRELTDEEYEEYFQKAKEAMDVEELSFARFFDISFLVDGEKIEPAASVDVEITYDNPVEIPEEQVKNAVHFTDEGTEVLDAELEQKDGIATFMFTQDSFSVVGTASGYAARAASEMPTAKSAKQTAILKVGGWYVLYAMCDDKSPGVKPAYAISTKDPTKTVPLTTASIEGGAVEWTASNEDILWQYTGSGFRNSEGKYLTLVRDETDWSQSVIGLGEQADAVDYDGGYHALYNYEPTPPRDDWGWTGHFNTVDFHLWNPGFDIDGCSRQILSAPSNPHYIALVPEGDTPDPTVTPTPTVTPIVTPDPIDPDTTISHHKTIDAFRDGQENPDTDVDNQEIDQYDLYRLYLDAVVNAKSNPVDLLIVVDQSGSMHKNYTTDIWGNYVEVSERDWNYDSITKDYKDMEDRGENKPKIFRDQAVRLVLNGTYNANEFASKYGEGMVSHFFAMNSENMLAVAEFHGKPDDTGAYSYNHDASTLLDWTSASEYNADPKYIDVNGKMANATNYCAGLSQANDVLNDERIQRNGHKKVMLFLSDGVPTVYLTKNDDGTYTKGGNGGDPYNTESQNYFKWFNGEHPELTTFTVGISKDINQPANDIHSPDVLKYMSSNGKGEFLGVESTEALEEAIRSVLNETCYSNLVIQDTLSEYIAFYDKPDFKVTMKSTDGKETVLYANGAITESGKNRLKEVTYDTVTKKVSAVFEPDYKLEAGYTYTLSFNVKTTQDAYQHHATHDYPHTGDTNTDYGTNTTSSNKPGYHSNQIATVEYKKYGVKGEEEYDHPVVQVKENKLTVEKKWISYDNEDITNTKKGEIQFKLYQNIYQKPDPVEPEKFTVTVDTQRTNSYVWHFTELTSEFKKGSIVTLQFDIKEGSFQKLIVNNQDVLENALEKKKKSGLYTVTYTYTYRFTISEDTNINIVYTREDRASSGQKISAEEPAPTSSDPVLVDSVLYRKEPYTLSDENAWKTEIKNLPQTGKYNNKDAYYTYVVKEVSVPDYVTTYENNDGITTGVITVKNKSTKPPTYELPETGGPGTIMYTMGGMLLMSVAGILLLYRKNKRRKEGFASS